MCLKKFLRRILLYTAVLWILTCLIPPVVYFCIQSENVESAPPISPSPVPSAEPDTAAYRILDTAADTILEVPDEEFLLSAILCEMSPDAPREALKAQAVAIGTHYDHLRTVNANSEYHFTCDTENAVVYMKKEKFAERFGERWESIYTSVSALCAEVAGQRLYYENELITAPFFAISAGCTQSNENVWNGDPLPYLRGVACPYDVLHSKFTDIKIFSPDEIRAAFPNISFTEEPGTWFSEPILFPTGYVESISLCGTQLTGVEVRTALSLRSAAFSVEFTDGAFRITTRGYGHGVGMSQAGAIYLAEQGESYENILSYFYPGTELKSKN